MLCCTDQYAEIYALYNPETLLQEQRLKDEQTPGSDPEGQTPRGRPLRKPGVCVGVGGGALGFS